MPDFVLNTGDATINKTDCLCFRNNSYVDEY